MRDALYILFLPSHTYYNEFINILSVTILEYVAVKQTIKMSKNKRSHPRTQVMPY